MLLKRGVMKFVLRWWLDGVLTAPGGRGSIGAATAASQSSPQLEAPWEQSPLTPFPAN
jgi:hypothetical protein